MPKNKTHSRCQQALPGDRLGQDPAREGRPAPQPGAQGVQGDPPHDRHHRGRQGRRRDVKKLLGSLSHAPSRRVRRVASVRAA